MPTRKLAEIWEVDDDLQVRVVVGAFQRALTSDPAEAENMAQFEVIEVLRAIVKAADDELARAWAAQAAQAWADSVLDAVRVSGVSTRRPPVSPPFSSREPPPV